MSLVIGVLVIVLFATAFIAVLLVADARMRGWRRMAAKFGTGEEPFDVTPVRQDGEIGSVGLLQLRGLFRAAANDDGLFLAAPRLIARTHPPLLIPWDQLALREDQTLLGTRIVRLSVGRVHLGFITLRGGIAGEVRDRLLRQQSG